MTSLLADVLVTAGKFETSDLLEKTSELQTQISKLEYDVKEFIESNYIEYQPELKHDRFLTMEVQKRVDGMNVLQRRLQDQMKIGPPSSSSMRELKSLSNNLQKSSIKLELSGRLMDLSNFLEAAENYRREKLFVQAAETLQQVHNLLKSGNTDTGYSGIFNALKREYCTAHAMISTDVSILWHGCIEWEIKEADPQPSSVKLSITCDVNDMQRLLAALDRMDIMANNLDKFSNMLMKNVITPIINYQCSVYVTNELSYSVETLNKAERPRYNSVIHNLLMLFKFLDHHLNFDVENDVRFLNKLGVHLFEQFSNSLTNDCISHTLPSSSTELQDFESVVKDISEFQDYLIEIGFITPDKIFLSRYIEDVDSFIINRKCQDFLEKARSMMKKDLHVSVRHEIQNPGRNPIADDETNHRDPADAKAKLGKHSSQLEPYQISESAKGIVDLVRKILSEACRSSDVCAVRLSQTSRNIFEMYAFFVPEHHKTFLKTIPQQVALFHNNCTYLAYHMFALTREYKDKIPGDPWKHNVTYVDLSFTLRSTGVECFLEHMKYQRNIIVDILKKSGWSMLGDTFELPPSTEKAIKQSIKQLKLLKRVWFNVLPSSMYCRSLGYIINSMMEELITSVFSVEYISVDVATELVTLLNMVLDGTSSILPEPEQIRSYARRWQKLSELVVVLGASLKEINDGWADGKGPLAREFTAHEVQHLIRMRFQNSEHKSMLLATSKLCLQ